MTNGPPTRPTSEKHRALRCARIAFRAALMVVVGAVVLWSANGIRFLANPLPRTPAPLTSAPESSFDPLLSITGPGQWAFRAPAADLNAFRETIPPFSSIFGHIATSSAPAPRSRSELFPLSSGAQVLCEKTDSDGEIRAQIVRISEDWSAMQKNLRASGWTASAAVKDSQPAMQLVRENKSIWMLELGSANSDRILLVIPEGVLGSVSTYDPE